MTDKKFEGLLLGLVGVGIALHYGKDWIDKLLPGAAGERPPTDRDTCFKQGGRWWPDVEMCQLPGQPPPPPPVVTPPSPEAPPPYVPPQENCRLEYNMETGEYDLMVCGPIFVPPVAPQPPAGEGECRFEYNMETGEYDYICVQRDGAQPQPIPFTLPPARSITIEPQGTFTFFPSTPQLGALVRQRGTGRIGQIGGSADGAWFVRIIEGGSGQDVWRTGEIELV